MRAILLSLCLLACTPAPHIDTTQTTIPDSGRVTDPPQGYIQWCHDHPEDTGCPHQQ